MNQPHLVVKALVIEMGKAQRNAAISARFDVDAHEHAADAARDLHAFSGEPDDAAALVGAGVGGLDPAGRRGNRSGQDMTPVGGEPVDGS